MARPRKDVSEAVVEGMAKVGASNVDIAEFCGVDETLIRRRFAELLTKVRADRRTKLREWQWNAAENGNTAMLIWLGKQHLGQTDKVEQNSNQTIVIKEKPVDTSPKTDNRAGLSTSPVSDN